MYIKYPLLIPTIGHGSTSLIVAPYETLFSNLLSIIMINFTSVFNRKLLLILFSIYHIAEDLNINNQIKKYTIVSLFHLSWLYKPIISKLYLSFIHTPLHYYKIYKNKIKYKQQIFIGFFTSFVSIIGLKYNLDIKLNKLFGELWFVGPIISHIIVHSYYNKKLLYCKKSLYYRKLFKNKIIFI